MPTKPKKPPRKTPPREEEYTLCGWNACRRAFERRPESLRRLFFSPERARSLSPVKKWCAEHKLPYRQLDSESLNKAAGGIHHEGVVMVVRPLPRPGIYTLIHKGPPRDALLVALDRVGNAHNVGAILRSCGYFGCAGLLLPQVEGQAQIPPAAARTAEGALETVPVYPCSDLPSALRDLAAKKVFVLGADLRAKRSLYDIEIPRPCVLVLGNEQEGLSDRVKKRCTALVRIPGGGDVESLNVSVAAGILLAELSRPLPVGGIGQRR